MLDSWDINCYLDWYQAKIGQYDQMLWEKNTEQRILTSLENRPMKAGKRPNSHLVDVDLIRGSAFEKAAGERRFLTMATKGIWRTLCLPLCLPWWRRHTSHLVSMAALAVYATLLGHVILGCCLLGLDSSNSEAELTVAAAAAAALPRHFADVAWPCAAFVALGLLQSYVAATSASGANDSDEEVAHVDSHDGGGGANAADAESVATADDARTADTGGARRLDPFADADLAVDSNVANAEADDDVATVDATLASDTDDSSAAAAATSPLLLEVGGSAAGREAAAESDDTEDPPLLSTDPDRLTSDFNVDGSTESELAVCDLQQQQESSEEENPPFVTWLSQQQQVKTAGKAIYCFVWPSSGSTSGSSQCQHRQSPPPPPRKILLSMPDIGWAIIQAVERSPSSAGRCSLLHLLLPALLAAAVPVVCRLQQQPELSMAEAACLQRLRLTLVWCQLGLAVAARLAVHLALYFVLCVADKTLWKRFLFAKHFCFVTSARRARKYRVPHFRLNKPRNIKVWLSLRSYLRRRGPQRSLDAVTGLAFYAFLAASCLLCCQLLNCRDPARLLAGAAGVAFCDALLLFVCVGCFLLGFVAVGARINRRFRSQPVLVTEQLNLCLAMETKPHRKEVLQLANSMLKLSEDLLKTLDGPYRVGGLVACPLVHSTLRLAIMSALSEVVSKAIGFKLMLDRISLS